MCLDCALKTSALHGIESLQLSGLTCFSSYLAFRVCGLLTIAKLLHRLSSMQVMA